MNKVILMGRLTRDPDVRYPQNDGGSTYARYTLAVDRRYRKDGEQQTADFISCVVFGKGAEFADKYFHKGIKIAITGRIQTGKYENKEGQTVYTTDVVIEDQEFAESKNASSQDGGQAATPAQAQAAAPAQAQQAQAYQPATGEGGFIDIPPGIQDDLPWT